MTTMDELDLDNASLEPDDEKTTARTRKPRSDKGQARGTRGVSTKKLEEDLLVPWAMIAGTLGMTVPTVGAVMLERGEKTVGALLNIAKEHPKMLKALKTASRMTPFSEIATTVLSIALAAALDFGRIPPDHPLAMNTGISQIYTAVHPPMPETNGQNVHFMPGPPPYPQGA